MGSWKWEVTFPNGGEPALRYINFPVPVFFRLCNSFDEINIKSPFPTSHSSFPTCIRPFPSHAILFILTYTSTIMLSTAKSKLMSMYFFFISSIYSQPAIFNSSSSMCVKMVFDGLITFIRSIVFSKLISPL